MPNVANNVANVYPTSAASKWFKFREPMTISAARTPMASTPMTPAFIFSCTRRGILILDRNDRYMGILNLCYLDINVQNVLHCCNVLTDVGVRASLDRLSRQPGRQARYHSADRPCYTGAGRLSGQSSAQPCAGRARPLAARSARRLSPCAP